jgi:hypothetical protein
VIEEMLRAGEPVILSRNGQPVGTVSGRADWTGQGAILTDQDVREIEAAVRQGDEDFATGRYMTLNEFRTKYASRLQDDRS